MVLLILILIAFGFFTVLQNQGLGTQIQKLEKRMRELEDQIKRLHAKIVNQLPGFLEESHIKMPETKPASAPVTATPTSKPMINCPRCWVPMEVSLESCDQCGAWLRPTVKVQIPSDAPVPPPAIPPVIRKPILPPEPFQPDFTMPAIDWETFMGVKLFAWLGGFALFLGMAFFVKYSLDHNLISPLMRVTIGFLIGIGSIIGGLSLRKKGYDVTVHTLSAAGISVLYADTFACRSFYNFLSPEVAFGLMVIITFASFLLAVRLDSRYVAILGLVGGFLTPPMMSTGVDHPIALFAYILLLDVGLAAVTIRQRWGFLLGLTAVATFLMEVGWTLKFFNPEKVILAMGIYVSFGLFFMLVSMVADQQDVKDKTFQEAADAMPLLSMGFAGYLLSFPDLGMHPAVLFTLIFSMLVLLGWRAIRRAESQMPYGLGTGVGFLLLSAWTFMYMTPEKVLLTAGFYLLLCAIAFFISAQISRSTEAGQAPADYLPLSSMAFVAYMLHFPSLGHRPGIVLSVLLILGGLLAYRALKRPEARIAYGLGGAVSFFLLNYWTINYMRSSLLLWGLGYYMAFAVVHTLYRTMFQRVRSSTKPLLAGFMAPILGLVLILVAMLACDLLSCLLWPFVLVLGMLGVALAWIAGSLLAAGSTVFLVMACFAVWLFRLPDPAGLGGVLMLLTVFAAAFFRGHFWSRVENRSLKGTPFCRRREPFLPKRRRSSPPSPQ